MCAAPIHDVIVVGARPAGTATALLLARAGLDVVVLDRERPGLDTTSTHALMRGAVIQLERWGVLDRIVAAGTPPVDQVTFHYGDEVVRVDLRGRSGSLYAPRRTVLDPLLVDAAREAGAQVRHQTTVDSVVREPSSGRVVGVEAVTGTGADVVRERWTARHVVAADGRGSRLATQLGATVQHRGTHSGAAVYRYVAELPTEGYEWVYRHGSAGGLIPTNGGRTCLWVGVPTDRFLRERHVGIDAWFDRQLARTLPEAAEMLRWLPKGRVRGYAGHPSVVRRPWGPGWSLVGDAGAYRDPITAHGITDALRDAELLATALTATLRDGAAEHTALGRFHRQRDRLGGPIVTATDRIASYDWDLDSVREPLLALSHAMRDEAAFLSSSPLLTSRR